MDNHSIASINVIVVVNDIILCIDLNWLFTDLR